MALFRKILHEGRLLSKCNLQTTRAGLQGAWFSSASFPSPQQISNNLSFHACKEESSRGEQGQPLVLLYSWLVAKAKHMHKFGDFYLQEGCDVLHIKLRPGELLWPTRGHAVAKEVLDFAHAERPAQPIIAHGFSVGCYLYTEMLVHILNDPCYAHMADRLRGQILDSPVDYHGIPFGVANAVTTNRALKKTIELSIRSYLAMFQQSVTQHYERASSTIKENALRLPSLLLYSQVDRVAAPATCEELVRMWRSKNIVTHYTCWPDSPHVSHYLRYPTEYLAALSAFMQQVLKAEQQESIVLAR